MKSDTPQGEIVKEYLRKYPSTASHKLAAVIFSEVPGLFKVPELARTAIRYYRGASGDAKRRNLTPDTYIPKVSMPLSEPENFETYILPDDAYPLIVGGDAHIPYHDQDALEIFIERAIEMEAKTVLLAGDWIDCYQVSRFQKDPRKRSIKEELETFKDVIGIIKSALPKAKIIFQKGNHEDRIDAYIMSNAPALFGLDNLTLNGLLDAKTLGIEIVGNKRIIKAGHLHIVHGHEFGMSVFSPVNPARGLYMRAKKSALCFHHHRSSSHAETAINGDKIITWSGGCLCGLHPEYLPINNWGHGFTEVTMDDGMFSVRNRDIVNYRLV